jgi:leucyl-tRNA synthetase
MQKNWIGKSVGAEIKFQIKEIDKEIKIFTTRPDTIYGATFIAISINHKIVPELVDKSEIQRIRNNLVI